MAPQATRLEDEVEVEDHCAADALAHLYVMWVTRGGYLREASSDSDIGREVGGACMSAAVDESDWFTYEYV